MASFDREKDVMLKSYGPEVSARGAIIMEAYSYDSGSVKLQTARAYKNKKGELQRGKLGRINAEEAEEMAAAFVQFAADMKEGLFDTAEEAPKTPRKRRDAASDMRDHCETDAKPAKAQRATKKTKSTSTGGSLRARIRKAAGR